MRHCLHIKGVPNGRQQMFFDSAARFTAYGGARGGGKSWALRRKLIAMCLRYKGIRCLLIRRTYAELKANHVYPLLKEYGALLTWSESEKRIYVKGGSTIQMGYCSSERDVLRYQGQEYDIIAIDEATQLSEYQFSIFKACMRGTEEFPRRMFLTCNPGGVGHTWVKRLFIDRDYNSGENAYDYLFIPAKVYDNTVLMQKDPGYVEQLKSLPQRLREAWLDGRWDVFEGQFFPEFDISVHTCGNTVIPNNLRRFAAMDYGFDMMALLICGVDINSDVWILGEQCESDLTLSQAANRVAGFCAGEQYDYLVASPDLWNRRQDTGLSGFEILSSVCGVPPMKPADDRRIPGWRVVHEYLRNTADKTERRPGIHICSSCVKLIGSMSSILCDPNRPEDAADRPHILTHSPEALRYALMSRANPPEQSTSDSFTFHQKPSIYDF